MGLWLCGLVERGGGGGGGEEGGGEGIRRADTCQVNKWTGIEVINGQSRIFYFPLSNAGCACLNYTTLLGCRSGEPSREAVLYLGTGLFGLD